MSTFKNIYKIIIAITLISLTVLCLNELGVINLGIKIIDNEPDTTGYNVLMICIAIATTSFVFSRAANVIANRKFTFIGYLAAFIGLLFILFTTSTLIFKFNDKTTILKINEYFTYAIIYLILILLVFEIPQANNSHKVFQIFTALVISVTLFFNIFINKNNNKVSNILIESNSQNNIQNNESVNEKIGIVLYYLSIATFIINPMMRVYYIDKDYNVEDEIQDIIDKKNKNEEKKNNINLNKSHEKKTTISFKNKNDNILQPESLGIEEIHEKVINTNFNPNNIPSAEIPTINNNSILNNNELLQNNLNDVSQQQSFTINQPQESIVKNDIIQPNVNTSTQNNVNDTTQVSTPLNEVVQPSVNTTPTQNTVNDTPQVSTPLNEVVQPNVNTTPTQNTVNNTTQVSTPLNEVVQPSVNTTPTQNTVNDTPQVSTSIYDVVQPPMDSK